MKKELFAYLVIFTAAITVSFAVLTFAKAFTSFTGA
jgi:hypothetical protein